jgi:hypothetical protein
MSSYKRQSTDDIVRQSKRVRQRDTLVNGEISRADWYYASGLRNFMLKDPILDWFKHCSSSKNFTKDENDFTKKESFLSYIMEKGNGFETAIMGFLKKKFPNDITEIGGWASQVVNYDRTIDAMERGAPIIYQGVVHNYSNNTYGSPDLIVRSDWVNKLTTHPALSPDEIYIGASGIVHYVVIDIKYHTLQLRADGESLMNNIDVSPYKAQVIIYNDALGEMQGYTPKKCFVLGRGYKYTKNKHNFYSDNGLDKLGVIYPETLDKDYKVRIADGLAWIRDLRDNGANWKATPVPDNEHLRPNMCNALDAPWHNQKKEIAVANDEITLLWQCGVAHRENALQAGISKWSDPDLTAKILGFKEKSAYGKIVQTMLDFNNGKIDTGLVVRPAKIVNNTADWKSDKKLEFYLDFEVINNVCDDFSKIPFIGFKEIIFVAGIGWKIPNNSTWNYKSFAIQSIDFAEEKRILTELTAYIGALEKEHNTKANIYHWSHAEVNFYNSAKTRHAGLPDLNWVDFMKIVQDEIILVKGVFDFSLKSYVRGMVKHGIIPVNGYNTSICGNGLDAMIIAYNCYKNKDFVKLQNIIDYNEIDCKMVYELINYLRSHNC